MIACAFQDIWSLVMFFDFFQVLYALAFTGFSIHIEGN